MIAEAPLAEILLDRRRPGRSARVSEHLIDLLRSNPDLAATAEAPGVADLADHREPGLPPYAHGVLVLVVLSVGLWSVIATTIWLVF